MNESTSRRPGERAYELANGQVAAALTAGGALASVTNLAARECYAIAGDAVEVLTDRGTFHSGQARCVRREGGPGRWVFHYEAPFGDVCLEYVLEGENPWLKRRVTLTNTHGPLTLEKVVLGRTTFAPGPGEFVNYDTFWNAPTVAFGRFGKGGLFTGIENPFFRACCRDGCVELAYEPAMVLPAGQEYQSEWQFVGVYRRSGAMVADHNPLVSHGRRPRFRNPCGHVPIDRAEVRAMQRFALDYLDIRTERFEFILYNFFYPLPQMPAAGSPEEAVHLKMLDTFEALGGSLVIFNPMHPYTRPGGRSDAYWDLGPEGSAARRIMDHARGKGMRFGFYMGCARHGDQGNACALPFVPERADWKKVDEAGTAAGENCIACDEYAEWFFAVQRNTIERFGLGLWSWDPGPGNGLFCHNPTHGHLPGRGGYKGWRNATGILRRLKEAFPGIYFQAYYGRKEHGLWGFKYFDQHESYWELGLWLCTIHPEFHADRMNADGVRHQGWWNQMFRFHPSLLTHGMVHRFQEGVFDPRLVKAWDRLGWKYSLMSGLACAGSITTVILPEDLALVPEMAAFYRTWLAWAREHFDLIRYNVPFGSPVRPGGVDGWARIRDGRGFLFLCNPGPRPARIQFALDDEIGLTAPGRFTLRELYPVANRLHFDPEANRGLFDAGQSVAFVVPAHEVVLLELAPFDERQLPLVFGLGGTATLQVGELRVSDAREAPGASARIVVLDTPAPAPRSLNVNGRPIPLRPRDGRLEASLRFAGRPLTRALDDWRTAAGTPFPFPRHAACGSITLTTRFFADETIRDLLARALPPNLAEFEPLLPAWSAQCSLDHFAWARPDRLHLVLPFVDAEQADPDALTLDGRPVPILCHKPNRKVIYYADLTDHVAWGRDNLLQLHLAGLGADQFLGPYLDYPPADPSTAVEPTDAPAPPVVVYNRPLDPETPPRLPTGRGDLRRRPVITAVAMDPPFLKQGQETLFTAALDMPPEQIEGVYISAPVADCFLRFDAATGLWVFRYTPWPRAGLIMDVPFYRLWALAKNGLISESRDIPLAWRF